MNLRPAHERHAARQRLVLLTIVVLAGLLLAHLVDRPAYWWLTTDDLAKLEERGWYQILRQWGYLPTWVLIAVVVGLIDRDRARRGEWPPASVRRTGVSPGPPRAIAIIAGAVVAGVLAEVLKLLIGRERPGPHEGGYYFKPFLHAFVDSRNLGLPSSHTAVAFGGAVALARLFPPAAWVLIGLAVGCGYGRVLSGAHFVSDVYAGAILGWLAGAWAATWVKNRSAAP